MTLYYLPLEPQVLVVLQEQLLAPALVPLLA
jgi:hypothetical protein